MKQFLFILSILVSTASLTQTVFWTEGFGSGCSQGLLYSGYFGPNGSWTIASTGTNAGSASTWYVSAMENGNEPGSCGSGCGSDRTMHIGIVNILGLGADQGASYYEGIAGLCGFFPCGATDKRVQSPTINCTGQYNITLDFDYIEGGNTIDNATVWYFNGSTWSQIADTPKTFDSACSPQGLWTHYSVALPASADNNPSVKIGFRWVNNEDGDATDPSFAVDDIELSVPEDEGDTEPPVINSCPGEMVVDYDTNCQYTVGCYDDLVEATDNVDTDLTIVQSPLCGTVINGTTTIVLTVTDDAGNSTQCSFNLIPIDASPPVFTCPQNAFAEAGANCQATVPDFISVLDVTDNCDNNPLLFQQPPPGTVVFGETIVLITATDLAGNSSACSFTFYIFDTTAPEIICPENIVVQITEPGATEAFVEVPQPAINENCPFIVLGNDFTGTDNATGNYPVGTTTVTWSAMDGGQNSGFCEMTVTVEPFPCCPADFDCNGVINVNDLLTFMSVFGSVGSVGDLNGDGLVNISDLLLFMAQFGSFCP